MCQRSIISATKGIGAFALQIGLTVIEVAVQETNEHSNGANRVLPELLSSCEVCNRRQTEVHVPSLELSWLKTCSFRKEVFFQSATRPFPYLTAHILYAVDFKLSATCLP